MGSFASLERWGLRTRRRTADHDFRDCPILRSGKGAGAHPDRGYRASSQRTLVALTLLAAFGLAGNARADKLSMDERLEISRGLNAEFATVKVILPRAKKPLVIQSDGQYDKDAWEKALREGGPAARLGDQIQITRVEIESNKI